MSTHAGSPCTCPDCDLMTRRALRVLTELERIPPEQRTEFEERFVYKWRTWLEIHPEWKAHEA